MTVAMDALIGGRSRRISGKEREKGTDKILRNAEGCPYLAVAAPHLRFLAECLLHFCPGDPVRGTPGLTMKVCNWAATARRLHLITGLTVSWCPDCRDDNGRLDLVESGSCLCVHRPYF